jgi:hypothetical protein
VSGRHALPLGLVAAALAASGPAWGYVRTLTNSGHPMRWEQHELSAILYVGSVPEGVSRELFLAAARAGARPWSGSALACTDLQFAFGESSATTADVAYDGASRITFRLDRWHKVPCDPTRERCRDYDPSILAVTSVWSSADGRILEVDMEINGVNQSWGDVVAEGARGQQDLQNVLTHEMGHFLGFDHTCAIGGVREDGGKPSPRDHLGRLVPSCHAATPDLLATTMYPSGVRGDTDKRDLAPDDIQAVCDLYPPDSGCAIASAGRSGGGAAPAAAVALAVLVLGGRRGLRFRGSGRRRR